MKNIICIVIACVVSACSGHQMITDSSVPIKEFGNDINLNVTGNPPEIANKLSRYIQANLLIESFNVVNDEQATKLDVEISEFNPGNQALRATVGFGAGRGSLVYNAKYSKYGKVLIDYAGAERFTGMEFSPGTKDELFRQLGGKETATKILLEDASKHIVDLAIKTKSQDQK